MSTEDRELPPDGAAEPGTSEEDFPEALAQEEDDTEVVPHWCVGCFG